MSLISAARAATLTAAVRGPQATPRRAIRTMVLSLALVLLASVAVAPSGASAASPYLTLTPSQGRAGTTVAVRGYNLPPRSRVQILWNGEYRGYPTAYVHSLGRFRTYITVPRGTAGLNHTITVASVAPNRTVVTRRSQLGATRARVVFRHLGGGTAVVPAPTPPPPTPAPAGAIGVPASIDATGARDASGPLNTWLRTVPNGSTVAFRAGGVYRMNSGLQVHARRNLTFLGQGATLRSHGSHGWQSSLFIVTASTSIKIKNFRLLGNSPTPGTLQFGREYAHGIYAYGSHNIDIGGITVDKVWGDALAVEEWTDGVVFHDSRVVTAGRNGVAIMAGRNIMVERVAFDRTGGSLLDIEPYQGSGGAIGVVFRKNTWRTHGPVQPSWGVGYFFGAEGAPGSDVHNVIVEDNVVTGTPLHTLITVSRRQNIVVRRNVSRVSTNGGMYGKPVMYFANIDGLTVVDNHQPMTGGQFVGYTNSTSVTVTRNTFR